MDEEDKRTISKVNDMISMTGGVLKSFARFDEGTGFAYELKFGWNEGWTVDRKEIVDRVIRLPGVKTMTPLDIRGSYDPFTNKTNGIMTIAISNKAKRYVSDDIKFKRSSSTPLMDEMEKTIELMNKRKREEEEEEEEKLESNSTETRKTKRRKKTRVTNDEAEESKPKDDEPVKKIKPETVEIHTVDGKVYEAPFQIINSNCFLFKECATYGEWETKGVPKEGFFMGILSKNFERLYTTMRYSVFPDDNFFMSDQEKRELEDDCAFYGVEYRKAPRARFNPIPENARDTTKGPVYFCVRCDYVVNDLSELGNICLECSNRPSSSSGYSDLNHIFLGVSQQVPQSRRCSCIKQVKVCHPCAKLLQCAIQKRWIADVEFVLSKMPQSQ